MKAFRLIIRLLFCIVLLFTLIYNTYLLRSLGLTYNKYILIALIIVYIIMLLLILGILLLKNMIAKVIIYIISTLVIITFSFIIYYLYNTLNFINNFGKVKDQYDYYYVIVNIDSKYHNIDDLDGKIMGVNNSVKEDILNKVSITNNKIGYDKTNLLYNDLKSEKVDFIYISDTDAYLLEEQLGEEFTKSIRIIKKVKIKKEIKIETEKEIDDSFILYISGIDTKGVISNVSRSDVNILVTVNTKTYQILLSTIPRDYYVQLHNTEGYKDKLTHAGIYGIDMSISTIEDLLDIKINYYLRVNFDTLIKLIDEIGDIEIYSDQDLSFCDIKTGYNTLNSSCALRFARERKSYETGDRHRGENQEEVLKAMINKIGSDNVLLSKYDDILKKLSDNFETNISDSIIKNIVKIQMKDMPKWNIDTYNLDGFNSYDYTYSYDNDVKLYVMEPDINTINNLKNYINNIINGKMFYEINN